ncbi:alpha/beta hydrolase [Aquabacterium sp. A7-Y]|uniref:alpha/beta fold hydrolase n=1 Tax=Aquabacterium sp. A7-Y TaxID=1349605 RepID=UPI00223CDC8F|nr:alpha/beta fold hydrolase [Aquabacterium sp. A7-Y]MCW7540820.1 alpha/beta hydrolase [Aquabacterium sp. A7-Y]
MRVTPFHALDELRRFAGRSFDAAGYAPQQCASEVLLQEPGLRLRRYRSDEQATRSGAPALLIVPAPIKRHYIWDLAPHCSVVRHALGRGFDVWLAEWSEAQDDDGLERYVERIALCADTVAQAAGGPPHLTGHSLGGTLAALHALRHPDQLASLALIEAPLHFGRDSGAFAPWLERTPNAADIGAAFGSVPGSLLNLAAVLASPREFVWDRRAAGVAAMAQGGETLRALLLATRWSLDELALPARLFGEVVDGLYREDQLMRGELELLGRRVVPADLKAPLAMVVDPRGEAIPAASMLPFHAAAGSADKLLLEYRGDAGVLLQHIGALVGANAHRELWPRLLDWMQARSGG